MRKILAIIFTISCLTAVSHAQTLQWSSSAKYGTGDQPSVSMNSSGVVIEVHKSQNYNTLYYHVGKLNRSNGVVTWGKSQFLSTKTEVRSPSVAITQNSNVIIVFDDGRLHLRYMTGYLNPTGSVDQPLNIVISDLQYDTGRTPQISVNASGTLIEVHQNNASACKLFYRTGYVDPETNLPNITWTSGTQGIEYEIGNSPHISLDDESEFVEVHREKSGTNLHYRRGSISNNQASFRASQFLSLKTGWSPAIALSNFGLTVSLYESSNDVKALAGMLFAPNPAQISWRQDVKLQSGAIFPSVSTDSDWIVAVWTRQGHANYDLQYSTARVP
jgi:hypothetical protein